MTQPNPHMPLQQIFRRTNSSRPRLRLAATPSAPTTSPSRWHASTELLHRIYHIGRQHWTTLKQPANTYGNSLPWMNAANMAPAQPPHLISDLPAHNADERIRKLSAQGQQQIAAQGATVDLYDSVNASNLQTLGTIRANAHNGKPTSPLLRPQAIPTDPTQHTEMATLQRINQALLLQLQQPTGNEPNHSGAGIAADGRTEAAAGQSQSRSSRQATLSADLQHRRTTAYQQRRQQCGTIHH